MKSALRSLLVIAMFALLIVPSLYAGEKPDLTFYGFVRAEAIYGLKDSPQGDWFLFAPQDGTARADRSLFTMSVRHSRVGMKFAGPDISSTTKVFGLVEMDFAGGFPNSGTAARQPVLRLRHAWVEIAKEKWALRMGQDWALVSGPFPNNPGFTAGAAKGNIWMRYPQLKFTWKSDPLTIAASINRPIAGNQAYNAPAGGDLDVVGDGERTGIPWVMGRVWYKLGSYKLSVSGHYGQENVFDTSGIDHDVSSWSVLGDVVGKVGSLDVVVRAFMGDNLNSFLAGIVQGVVTSASDVKTVQTKGGFVDLGYAIGKHWKVNVGGGADMPDDENLTVGMRESNTWGYGKLSYMPIKNVVFAGGAEFLQTEYYQATDGDDLRFLTSVVYKF